MKNILKVVLSLLFIAIILYGIFYLRVIISYILIAGILALLGRPIMNLLKKIKIGKFEIPKSIRALLTIFSFYAVIIAFIATFLPLVIQEFQVLVRVLTSINYVYVIELLGKQLESLENIACEFQPFPNREINVVDYILQNLRSLLESISFTNLFGTFLGFFGNIFTIIATFFSVTFITFFFLTDHNLFYNFAGSFVPTKFENSYDRVTATTKNLLTRYFMGILFQMSLVGTLVTIGLLFFGVENALLIGFFAGVINIIPYIGPIIGMVFGLFVGLTTNLEAADFLAQWLPLTAKMLGVFLTVQTLDNIFFQPLIFSSSIKAHPLEIFLMVSVGYTFMGIGGMILAIPCYTVVRVMAKELWTEFG